MAGRRRSHRFSKRMLSGIIFVLTSFVGGIVASVGEGLYNYVQSMFALNEIPLSFPEIAFLLVGLVGITLILSDLRKNNNQAPTVSRRRSTQ